MTSALEFF